MSTKEAYWLGVGTGVTAMAIVAIVLAGCQQPQQVDLGTALLPTFTACSKPAPEYQRAIPAPTTRPARWPTTWPADDPPAEWNYENVVLDNREDLERLLDWLREDPRHLAAAMEAVNGSGDGRELANRLFHVAGQLMFRGCPVVGLRCACFQRIEVRRKHDGRTFAIVEPPESYETYFTDPRVGEHVEIAVVFDRPITWFEQSAPMMGADLTQTWRMNEVTFHGTIPDRKVFDYRLNLRGVDKRIQVYFLAGDVDGSGVVDMADLISVRDHIDQKATSDTCRYDLDCNGKVNLFDLAIIRNRMEGAPDG